MGGEKKRFSGVKKLEGIDFTEPIRRMISGLRKFVRDETIPVLKGAPLVDLKALVKFTLSNIVKCNYHLICKSLDLNLCKSMNEIRQEAQNKWEAIEEFYDFEKALIGLENIYANSEFLLIKEDYQFIRDIINRFYSLFENDPIKKILNLFGLLEGECNYPNMGKEGFIELKILLNGAEIIISRP